MGMEKQGSWRTIYRPVPVSHCLRVPLERVESMVLWGCSASSQEPAESLQQKTREMLMMGSELSLSLQVNSEMMEMT